MRARPGLRGRLHGGIERCDGGQGRLGARGYPDRSCPDFRKFCCIQTRDRTFQYIRLPCHDPCANPVKRSALPFRIGPAGLPLKTEATSGASRGGASPKGDDRSAMQDRSRMLDSSLAATNSDPMGCTPIGLAQCSRRDRHAGVR